MGPRKEYPPNDIEPVGSDNVFAFSSSRNICFLRDDDVTDRGERRGLLPLSSEELRRTSEGLYQPKSSISVRRKMHDRRLHAILSSKDEENYKTRTDDWMRPYWLGFGLFLILYSFWILDTLKDPIFGALIYDTFISCTLRIYCERAKKEPQSRISK
jgi:hypothetical protein